MNAILVELNTTEQLESLFSASFERPVLLLKHSKSCGTSLDILYQLRSTRCEINVLVVQDSRALSNLIEDMLGHRHHSPQAFIIENGEATYHATHYGIDPIEIERRLFAVAEVV
jgi:bacillithiol system protein YtxJ